MAAKQLVGFLEPYTCGENFNDYLERVENYFELNDVVEEKYKVLLLCNVIGAESSTKLNKACLPIKPKEMKYAEVVERCKLLFTPPSKTCTSAVRFGRRYQKEGETVNEFATELMVLAEPCDFGGYKNKALRNQFIIGLMGRRIKAEMMVLDDKVEFKDVVQKALALEMVDKDLHNLESGHPSGDINRVHDSSLNGNRGYYVGASYQGMVKGKNSNRYRSNELGKRSEIRCFKCQCMGHLARQCPSGTARGFQREGGSVNSRNNFDIRCFTCQGMGHVARECPSETTRGFQREGDNIGSRNNFRNQPGKFSNGDRNRNNRQGR